MDFWQFIEQHRNEDPNRLRLKYYGTPYPWVSAAIAHIECLKKCGKKFGTLQPEVMVSPLSVEQATSASVAHLHGRIAREIMPHGGSLLDMTCGMGIDCRAIVEATGATATAIELNPTLAKATAYNLRNIPSIKVINADSVEWLTQQANITPTKPFDLIFIDPARRDDSGGRVFNLRDCTPDLIAILPLLRRMCRHAMVKMSPMLDVTQTLRDLPATSQLHVVETGDECRELLAVLDFTTPVDCDRTAEPTICIDMCEGENTHSTFAFTRSEERGNHATFGQPHSDMFLFEPGAATMKAQPFATLCSRHGLLKLHPDTHLFIADAPTATALPGRWYKIVDAIPFSASALKKVGQTIGNADVTVRNFPLKADELQHRLKIKSDAARRLFGVTTLTGRMLVLGIRY